MIDKTVVLTLLFDVFNIKLGELKELRHEAKYYYNDCIKRNQRLINEINTQLKKVKIEDDLTLVDLYDDFSLFFYNIVDKFETLPTEELKKFIEYINSYKP